MGQKSRLWLAVVSAVPLPTCREDFWSNHNCPHRSSKISTRYQKVTRNLIKTCLTLFQLNFVLKVSTIVLLSSYPFIAMLKGIRLTLLVNSASILKNVLSVSSQCLSLILLIFTVHN